MILENVRCLLPEESNAKFERNAIKIAKCEISSILSSINNT
jgi:hypothetical protein